MTTTLLDPTNDYVFKRLFAENPDLLVALINDLRPDLPAITRVDITNPNIEPSELAGKYIILDVLARDNYVDKHRTQVTAIMLKYRYAVTMPGTNVGFSIWPACSASS